MSLLMEALRKAEEAKRRIQNPDGDAANNGLGESVNLPEISPAPAASPSPDSDLTLLEQEHDLTADYIVDNFLRDSKKSTMVNTAQYAASAPGSLSDRPTRASVEELQNYLATTPELEETPLAPRVAAPVNPSPAVQQRTASSVFAAKQKPAPSHATRNGLFALAVVIVLIGGGAFWYITNQGNSSLMIDPALLNADVSNRSFSDDQFNAPPPAQPREQISPPAAAMADQDQSQTAATDPQIPAVPADLDRQEQSAAADVTLDTNTATAGLSTPPQMQTRTDLPGAPQPTVTERTSAAASESSTLDAVADSPSTVLEISHSKGTDNNNQQLLDAYAALQAGDTDAASVLYQQVLEQLPNNRDALLGGAAIALRENNIAQARDLYSRLMRLNPKDPLARTGLLQTVQDIDPVEYEQELQRLLQQFPGVAPLSFALGNAYAAQGRWNEAQTAYFDALLFARRSNETFISPDYAYNLAISLEQINQPAAALDYYRQAQTLARDVTPGFDMQTLSRRISLLEQNRP